jgi:hypothetical protein
MEGRKTPPVLPRVPSLKNLFTPKGDQEGDSKSDAGKSDTDAAKQLDALAITSDNEDDDELTDLYLKYTSADPIGSMLLNLATDNSNLCDKVGLHKSHTSIKALAKTFYLHSNSQKQIEATSAERNLELIEQKLLEKELNSYMMTLGFPPPKAYSTEKKLLTVAQKSDAYRIFPVKNKFSGEPGSLGIVEYLYSMNSAQEACELSRPEFKDMILATTTGRAHALFLEWYANGETIETMYHNALTHYDTRLTPGEAKKQLFAYRIPKTKTMVDAVATIMDLASRAASALPPGESRSAYYNYEATEALLRALPPASRVTASNLHAQLSAKLGRSASITELSRALNIYRMSIDEEIKSKGVGPEGEKPPGKKFSKWNKNGNRNAGPATTFSVNMPNSPQGNQPGNSKPQSPQNSKTGGQQNPNQNKKGGKGGKKNWRKNFNSPGVNYCSLCGAVDHVASNGCANMRDDAGKIVHVMPTQTTCGLCPMMVSPRLQHPQHLCPFRAGGPFASN